MTLIQRYRLLTLVLFTLPSMGFMYGCMSMQHGSNNGDTFILTGFMRYSETVNGCWEFVGEDNLTYEIVGLNLTPLYREGQRFELVLRNLPGVGSICDVNKVVQLVEIVTIYEGSSNE